MVTRRSSFSNSANVSGKGWGRTAALATWLSITATWALMHVFQGSQQLLGGSLENERSLEGSGKEFENRVPVVKTTGEGEGKNEKRVGTGLEKEGVLIGGEREEEMYRALLRETREGSVSYQKSQMLDQFWNSMELSNLAGGGGVNHGGKEGSEQTKAHVEKDEEKRPVTRNEVTEELDRKRAEVLEGGSGDQERESGGKKKKIKRGKEESNDGEFGRGEVEGGTGDADSDQRWIAPKECANVEEMGQAVVGDVRQASLKARRLIVSHFESHGATRLRQLPEDEFCQRGFVMCKGQHDGFGNNLYKILTGGALSIMLNRSMIIGESGPKLYSSTDPEYVSQRRQLAFPFGDYLEYSPEMISMQELKQLWVKNGCTSRHGRPFTMRVDYFSRLKSSKVLCEDWTMWKNPVLWFADTTDAVGLQWFLKNKHRPMRLLARALMGSESDPDSRGNLFGELSRALLTPKPVINKAIKWVLHDGEDPDFVLHIRHGKVLSTIEASTRCVMDSLKNNALWENARLPRVAVISDTPEAADKMATLLNKKAEVVKFDFNQFVKAYPNISTMSSTYFTAPATRIEDWGPLPRWVAMVEFFLAARARLGFVSGAGSRVATTFAQLAASLAAANRLGDDGDQQGFAFHSSFQEHLLERGLQRQSGRGYAWHTFGGMLSCLSQHRQCALTPLLPYAWWDAPWQAPVGLHVRKLRAVGLLVTSDGEVSPFAVKEFCRLHEDVVPVIFNLALPDCKDVEICVA